MTITSAVRHGMWFVLAGAIPSACLVLLAVVDGERDGLSLPAWLGLAVICVPALTALAIAAAQRASLGRYHA